MPRYPTGQPVRVSTTVKDVAGVLTDPGDISVQLQNALTGTTTTYDYNPGPIVRDGVGLFHLDLSSLTAGLYPGAWITTGTAAGVSKFLLNVVDPFSPAHISAEDVKARLNMSATDGEIQDMIDSAISEQETGVGPVAPRTVTETVTASGGRLWLSTRPVLSVVSATLSGSAVSVTSWSTPSPLAGYISADTWLYGTYVVIYRVGRSPVPQDLVEAALLRVQHSYETQRGPADSLLTEQVEGPGASFVLLLRAREKEAPYVLPVVV